MNGNPKDAIDWYQRAIRQLATEVAQACPECGGPESYWEHIWTGHIMAIEAFVSNHAIQCYLKNHALIKATGLSQTLIAN